MLLSALRKWRKWKKLPLSLFLILALCGRTAVDSQWGLEKAQTDWVSSKFKPALSPVGGAEAQKNRLEPTDGSWHLSRWQVRSFCALWKQKAANGNWREEAGAIFHKTKKYLRPIWRPQLRRLDCLKDLAKLKLKALIIDSTGGLARERSGGHLGLDGADNCRHRPQSQSLSRII